MADYTDKSNKSNMRGVLVIPINSHYQGILTLNYEWNEIHIRINFMMIYIFYFKLN